MFVCSLSEANDGQSVWVWADSRYLVWKDGDLAGCMIADLTLIGVKGDRHGGSARGDGDGEE